MRANRSEALALVVALAWPTSASAAVPRDVALDIDAKALGSFEQGVVERIEHDAVGDLAEIDFHIAPEARARISIHVEFVDGKKTSYAYRLVSSVDGKPIESSRVEGVCDKCVQEDVVARIDAEIGRQANALSHALQESDAEPAAPGPTTATPGDRADLEPDPLPERRALGALGKAGIATGVIGLAVLATGIGLALRSTTFDPGDNPERETGRDTGTAGIALAVAGGIGVVAAIPMIIVDRRRAKRATRIAPILSPRWAGLGVSGRF